uniref:Uncharacterized protein n=1 Tax=Microviridae sp. ctJby12 TaxID=2827622 RepID=A0A8S5LMZ9_9VIRU|nr:MAG TPA: hypothetical protein [Microviridae sp. ctJby12]
MPLSTIFKKIYLEIQKKVLILPSVEVTTIINILNILQLCKNLLFPLRKKPLVVMLFRLMLLILSKVLDIILSEFLDWVLSLLWIRLERKIILLNLKLKLMKSNHIWKIVIGAISAALGYILSAIGV